jgi:quinol monooxygenase YgiN
MSIAYVGQSQAKKGESENLRNFLVSVVSPAVRASAGCESCLVLQSETDPTKFIAIELWAPVEAHRASVKNIPAESIATFMQLVAAPPSGGYYRVL